MATLRRKLRAAVAAAALLPKPIADDAMLSTAQLCGLTSTGETYWNNLRVTGGGPKFFKLGRSCRYRWGDVKAWLRTKEKISTSDAGGNSEYGTAA